MSSVVVKCITTIELLHNMIEKRWSGSRDHEMYVGIHDYIVV